MHTHVHTRAHTPLQPHHMLLVLTHLSDGKEVEGQEQPKCYYRHQIVLNTVTAYFKLPFITTFTVKVIFKLIL